VIDWNILNLLVSVLKKAIVYYSKNPRNAHANRKPIVYQYAQNDGKLKFKKKKNSDTHDAETTFRSKTHDHSMNVIFSATDFVKIVQGLLSNAKTGNGTVFRTKLTTLRNDHWGLEPMNLDITFLYLSAADMFPRMGSSQIGGKGAKNGGKGSRKKNIIERGGERNINGRGGNKSGRGRKNIIERSERNAERNRKNIKRNQETERIQKNERTPQKNEQPSQKKKRSGKNIQRSQKNVERSENNTERVRSRSNSGDSLLLRENSPGENRTENGDGESLDENRETLDENRESLDENREVLDKNRESSHDNCETLDENRETLDKKNRETLEENYHLHDTIVEEKRGDGAEEEVAREEIIDAKFPHIETTDVAAGETGNRLARLATWKVLQNAQIFFPDYF